VAGLIKQEMGVEVALQRGWLGELSVWVDGRKVARKGWLSTPDDEFFVSAIRRGLAGTRCTPPPDLKSSIP